MSLWAIVPVKPIRRGKSRLAPVLTEEDRTKLNLSLLNHVLSVLTEVPAVNQILVISRDSAVLSTARDYGAKTLQEDSTSNLNRALERATTMAQIYETREIIILPADLPLITALDVSDFLSQAGDPPEMLIAPDRHGTGTNALYINPIGKIKYRYGENSFQLHREQAIKNGFKIKEWVNPSFGFDLDVPEDLALLQEIEKAKNV